MSSQPAPKRRFPNRDPQLMYEVARDHVTGLLTAADAADAKMGMLVAWGGAAPAILAAMFALRQDHRFTVADAILLGLSLLAFYVLTVIAYLSLSRKRWNLGPNLRAVWRDHWEMSEREVMWEVAADYIAYYKEDYPKYATKITAIRRALGLALVETTALVIGLILVAAGK